MYLRVCLYATHSVLFFSASSSLARHPVTRGSTFASSTSTEELTPDHTSISEAADSGRGSWTSCSSNSHDNFQSLQAQRALDLMNHRNPPMGGPIAEVEVGPAWPEDRPSGSRHSGDSSDLNQSRQSWASSSSLSDTYEGSYGTIKRKASEHSGQGETANGQQSTDSAYKTVTSSTEKGLIGEFFSHMWGGRRMVPCRCCLVLLQKASADLIPLYSQWN